MKALFRVLVLAAVFSAASILSAEGTSAVAAEKKTPAPAVSATGVWHLQVETGQGTGTPAFTFKQDGETISGQYKGLFGEAPVTGSLKGAEIKFTIKVNVQGQDMTIAYSGVIEGDTMKGKVNFGNVGEATFTGKRQAN